MADPTSSPAIRVPLARLKEAVDTILEHLILDVGVESVVIEPGEDFYWDMDEKSLHDMANKKPELGVGSLADDWDFLSKVIGDREGDVGLMLIHAAPLLRYVGEKIGR